MADFTFQLVLQIPARTSEDFDELIALEDAMTGSFGGLTHSVDGHDFGTGEMNLFVLTDDPNAAFEISLEHFSADERKLLKAGYRKLDDESYTTVWPPDSSEVFRVT